MRHHGLTIDSLQAADVVLADGQLVRASADEHPELFWALRGGGGDFGVVTAFEFRAHRVGPIVLAGVLLYPWEQARDAFRASRDLMADAPEELTIFDVVVTAPPGPPFPPELQGRRVAIVGVAWSGDIAEGERVLAPLREGLPPAVDMVGPMPYVALQSMLDQTAPHHWRYYDRQHYLNDVSDEFLDALLTGFESVPTPESHIVTGWMGGATERLAPGETAFGHRGAPAFTWIIGCSGEAPIAPAVDWVRRVWDATAPFATGGVYANALHDGRSVRDAYADDVWERLRRREAPLRPRRRLHGQRHPLARIARGPLARRARPPRRGCARRASRARG